jgi:hypothetical protein
MSGASGRSGATQNGRPVPTEPGPMERMAEALGSIPIVTRGVMLVCTAIYIYTPLVYETDESNAWLGYMCPTFVFAPHWQCTFVRVRARSARPASSRVRLAEIAAPRGGARTRLGDARKRPTRTSLSQCGAYSPAR